MAYREMLSANLAVADDAAPSRSFDLDKAIEHIAHWLPTQAPIKDFIHHNTLHAVQHLPFHEGVAVAAKIFGANSYLPLDNYQALYWQGRIKDYALDWALAKTGLDSAQQDELRSTLFDADPTCHYPPQSLANHGIRVAWLNHLELDLNNLAHPVLFRLLANFLDQGISQWTLPKTGERFWDCMLRLAQNSLLPLYPLNEPGVQALMHADPHTVVLACLARLVGSEQHYEQYLLEMLLAHPGWSGIVRVIEQNPKVLLERRAISLKELLALELCLELAFAHKKHGHGFPAVADTPNLDAAPTLANALYSPQVPMHIRVWQEAMEWSLHTELLLALRPTADNLPPVDKQKATAQALFCIDDRECSLRRHLEELDSSIETFGAAGFFGIDFLYQGLDDAYPVAQCPAVVTPKHLIKESASNVKTTKNSTTDSIKHMHFSSHSIFRGWLYTQTLGIGYALRMAWNVFRPGGSLPNIGKLGEIDAHSQLHLLRETDTPTEDGYLLGFSLSEMADRIAGLLTNIGLTQNFAPLVVVVAHGSSSVNNPHFAAYDCGACSGKPGAPNARAFAWMTNHKPVRDLLRERGIDIPDGTHFVAALHNTSRDEITYFDLDTAQQDSMPGLRAFQNTLFAALQHNARERCRWFELGPQEADGEAAHRHVIARASSIFEPRPELNHSNNLYCIVGRRRLSHDLYLDRRAFLHSYDPDSDPQGGILLRILGAIIPVCGGINLEYLFSRIDNSVYGAGTKLPHNVIGLLGVANGTEGDLRTGLPSQMIEVHEPARLLIVIEQSPGIISRTIAKLGPLKEWLDNEWVRLVAHHPQQGDTYLYSTSGWEPIQLPVGLSVPAASNSEQIYAGQTGTIPVHQLQRRPT